MNFPFRFSTRPHKQFLWLKLFLFSRNLKNNLNVLDAGCANLKNKRFFSSSEYLGIDPDQSMLANGLQRYPQASVLCSNILDFQSHRLFDVVLCVQVLVNSEFIASEAPSTVKKLVSLTSTGGSLFFNTSKSTHRYQEDFDDALYSSFATVNKIEYSTLNISNASKGFSLFVALLMLLIPGFKTITAPSKILYICYNKV